MIVLLIGAIIVLLYVIIAYIYNKFWNYNLKADIYLPKTDAYEGDLTQLVEILVNDKYLPLPTVEIDFNLDKGLRFLNNQNSTVSDKLYRRDVFSAGMKRKVTRTLDLYCLRRGYYTLDSLGMMGKDIFMQQRYLDTKKFFEELYVYPRKVNSQKILIPYTKIMGEVLSRQKLYEDPFEFAGIRDYQITDPMKFVNWKASAKSSKLVVNMFDTSLAQNLTIVLDTFDNMKIMDEELNEESIRIVSGLVEKFLSQGMNLTILGNAHDKITGKTLNLTQISGLATKQVRQNLAKLVLGEEKPIESLFSEIAKDDLVVVVSKNTDIGDTLDTLNNDIVWVVPYKFDRVELAKKKYNTVLWEYETPEINKAVKVWKQNIL